MTIQELTQALVAALAELPLEAKVDALNEVRRSLHEVSPFRDEPVDCVVWVPAEDVIANDYNPNEVASKEMALLHLSIQEDGFTQPIVGFPFEAQEFVVDGFHRNRIGKEKADIRARLHGYLPIAEIHKSLAELMASTIRHNRARGKHRVDRMSDLVLRLLRLDWNDVEIAKRLGMEAEEVLRLKQQTGLPDLFKDQEFSRAWVYQEGVEADAE